MRLWILGFRGLTEFLQKFNLQMKYSNGFLVIIHRTPVKKKWAKWLKRAFSFLTTQLTWRTCQGLQRVCDQGGEAEMLRTTFYLVHLVALTFDSIIQTLPSFKAMKPLIVVLCDLKRKETILSTTTISYCCFSALAKTYWKQLFPRLITKNVQNK